MTRAVTSGELGQLRLPSASELCLAIWKPAVVFSCRVNGAPSSNDGILQLTYDGATGTYTDVQPGMTCYVGTSAGAYNKGMVRIRKALSATVLYIGETSEIQFEDNDYLTVVEEFGLWARHIRRFGDEWRIDAVDYTDQHNNYAPVVNIGPIAAVLWKAGNEVSFSPDASGSWVVGGSITSYSHGSNGASAIADGGTAQPTITYDAAGQYLRSCTVQAATGRIDTGYRYVFVFDNANPPITQFALTQPPMGSRDDGGWSFAVRMYDEAALADVRDRALCVLFTKDTPTAMGEDGNHANILAVGWIGGESIEYNSQYGTVNFTVYGAHYWLANMTAFPAGLKDTTGTPTSWLRMNTLTVDKALWHFLHWRCTASNILDIRVTGDTRRLSATEASLGGLWEQMITISGAILAKPACDRFGRLYVEIPANLTSIADRAGIPIVMTLTGADWRDTLRIERRTRGEVGQIEIGGIAWTGLVATPLFARSPGKVMGRHGAVEKPFDTLALADQDQCVQLAGLIMGQRNNPYPVVSFTLAQDNRFIDICPLQYLHLDVEAGDTPRGLALSLNVIPNRVTIQYENGSISVEVEAEGETDGTAFPAVPYTPPSSPQDNSTDPFEPGLPGFDPLPPPNSWFPPYIPPGGDGGLDPEPSCLDLNAPANYGGRLWFDPASLISNDPAKTNSLALKPCTLRPSAAVNKSYIDIEGSWNWQDGAGEWWQDSRNFWWKCYAIDSGRNRLLQAGLSTISGGSGWQFTKRATFEPVGSLGVAGFEIEIEGIEGSGLWTGEGKGFTHVRMDVAHGGDYGIYQGDLISSTIARYYREYTYWGGTQPWPNNRPIAEIQYGGAAITEIVLEVIPIGWNGVMYLDWGYITRWYPTNDWVNETGFSDSPSVTHLGGSIYRYNWVSNRSMRAYVNIAWGDKPIGSLQRYHWDVLIRSINGEEAPDLVTSLSISDAKIYNVCA
ncbi:MAG TPA: hypothetical protein VLH56_05255 [Dissulfurispiraceae bacterium]|nr:hypothetical protein [Dissulfurispiraceae bacterium]